MKSAPTFSESAKSRPEFADFLKRLRLSIPPSTRTLGKLVRQPSRVGKPVTQQELSEAVGISREWYGALESSATVRTSMRLLDRLADALTVTPEDRARLFQLALPELHRAPAHDDSIAVLDSFARLRSLTQRLWVATSVDEIFATATEQISSWFAKARSIQTFRRRELDAWESQLLDESLDQAALSPLIRELECDLLRTPESVDGLHLYPQLVNAGDTGSIESFSHSVQQQIFQVYERRRIAPYAVVKSRVRSRTGLIADICVFHEFGHEYSASDRAAIGAFAEITSLVLS